MAYTDKTACEKASGGAQNLIELCDLDGNAPGTLDQAVLDQAIADASGWIDAFVAKQRAVPLNPVPPFIARIAAQETVYRLRSNKPRAPIGEREEQRHQENLQLLRDVAKGTITLGVDPQPAKSALVSPAVVSREDSPEDFEITACKTKGFW